MLILGIFFMILALFFFYGAVKAAPKIVKRMETNREKAFTEHELKYNTEKVVLILRIIAFVCALLAAGILAIDTYLLS